MKNIKRLFSIALAIVLLFSGIPMAELGISDIFTAKAAYEITDEDLVYNDFLYRKFRCAPEGTAIPCIWITKYLGADEHITVPSEIEGLPVMIIDEYAFSPSTLSEIETPDCINIKSITIPDTVIQINGYAFYACANLEQISLPDTIEYIGACAFGYCTSLESIKLPYSLQHIQKELFKGCSSLVDVDFGDEMNFLQSIESDAFSGTAIKSLTIPKNSQKGYFNLNKDALNGSSIENLTVETDWTCVFDYSLDNDCLKEVVFEGGVSSFGRYAFGAGTIDTKPDRIVFETDFIDDVYSQLSSQGYLYYRESRDTDWTVFVKPDEENQMLVDGNYGYYINTNDEAVIIAHAWEVENGETITVPDTLGGKKVVEIGFGVFRGYAMSTVNLPDTLEHIGGSVFRECKNLKQVNFGSSVISIGDKAFEGCTALENITIPENVKSLLTQTFYNCTSLKNISAKSVEKIGDECFYSCGLLNNAEFSDKLSEIGHMAFYKCTSLKKLNFTDELTAVGEQAFDGCTQLESIGISGESITSIGRYAFSETAIKSFAFSSELDEIPHSVFRNSKIAEVTIPEGIKSIGHNAFRGCTSLSKINIPSSVTEIYEYAFYGCSALNGTLALEKSLINIGDYAFSGTNFSTLYYNLVNLEVKDDPNETYIVYAFRDTGFEKIIIGDDVKILPNGIFMGQSKAEIIEISDSVTVIGNRTFMNCTSLTNIAIPTSVTEIGLQAFEGCTALKNVEFSDSADELRIKSKAFNGCTALTEFTVCKGVKKLYRTAIPSSVTTVYFNAANCEFVGLMKNDSGEYISPFANGSITKIVIGDTVKRIPDYFMSSYGFVDELILPESVTEIGINAFKNSSITTVTLPSKLISIESGAFGNTAVQLVGNTFPESLRMIGEKAFADCNALTELDVPDTVVYIDEGVFMNCANLAKVRMSVNVKYLMANTFYGCKALKDFVWDADVKLIGKETFAYCEALSDFDFIGVEKIYPNSFNFSGVKVVALGENKYEQATDLVSVEKQSFKNCADLETLSVGGNVATIKSEAFADCSNLEVAVISNSVINIATDAFDGCNSLTIYCMENSYAHNYAVQNNIPVSTFVIAPIPNQTYTGSKIEPELDVSVSNKQLTENMDFAVKYADNINVGTAKVTVSGKGIYKVLTSIANFTIITKNIAPVTIAPVADQNYTGEAVTPSLTVTDGSNILKEGTDYTVTYKNNVDVGTATATIQGIGNYSGTASVNFTILEQTFFEKVISAITTFFTTIITWLQALFGIKIK